MMFQKILVIIFFILFVLGSVGFVHLLRKKGWFINRWIFGFASFLVVILPLTFAQQLPSIVVKMLYVFSGVFAIMFFETTRLKLEHNEYKGIVRVEQFSKKERGK